MRERVQLPTPTIIEKTVQEGVGTNGKTSIAATTGGKVEAGADRVEDRTYIPFNARELMWRGTVSSLTAEPFE